MKTGITTTEIHQSHALSLILYNLSLNPSSSVSTAENADNTTTLVIFNISGFAEIPEILNGLSSSLRRLSANLRTLLATISSSFLCGFCSICRYKLICSVISTDRLRYFLLIRSPSVINRSKYTPSAMDQSSSSQLTKKFRYVSASLNSCRHMRIRVISVVRNAEDTITSTDL